MSVTISFAGNTAVLADGQWRSANEKLRELLNSHLEASQLAVPGHLPPGDRELELARLACRELGGKIIDARRTDTAPARQPDGNLTVF
jgi:hypothetical protein